MFFGAAPHSVLYFVVAFIIVLGFIGAAAWLARLLGPGRLGGGGMRGRHPRLAVMEYANLDGRRRLILVRRDNVEHLVMVGGPTDIVVEPSIMRAAAPRDAAVTRAHAAIDTLPRPIPPPESAGHGSGHGSGHGGHGPEHGSLPLPPEPAAAAAPRRPRNGSWPEEQASWPLQPQAEVPPVPTRAQRETLAALADELSSRPLAAHIRPQANPRPLSTEQRPQSPAPAVQPGSPEAAADADRSLAEMAHRLEAALRKSTAKTGGREARTPATPSRASPPPDEPAKAEAAPEAPEPPASPAPSPPLARNPRNSQARPRTDGKPPNPGQTLYDSLEQEMASLLGRPSGKT
ncbi:MAG: flagellar biosynthetic protein FliO [Methylocella sp.]